MMQLKKMATAVAAAASLMGAGGAMAQPTNVLVNPGFESFCGPAGDWETSGNVSSINFYTTSGARAIKMFGPFNAPLGYSLIWQDKPAAAGQVWEGSANCTNPFWDAFTWDVNGNGSRAFVEISFLDSSKVLIEAPQTHISTKLQANTGESPVPLFIPGVASPPGTAYVRLSLVVEQGGYIGGAAWWDDADLRQAGGSNVLTNSSFENQSAGCVGSPFVAWVNFGNGQGNFGENVLNGNYAAKLFGGYNSPVAYSGWFQNVPTTAGKRYKARGWARSSPTDSLQPVNDVFVGVEFFDNLGNNMLGTVGRSAGVPTPGDGVYRQYEGTSVVAPLDAVTARCLVLQVQFDFAGGATWWDDMELIELCTSDFNGDEFSDAIDYDLFIAAWLASDISADINADTFVDAIDYDVFVSAWLGGC